MWTFVKLVAAFLVALILLIVGVLAFLRWKFRRWLQKMVTEAGNAQGIPPFRIKLQACEDDEEPWMNAEKVGNETTEFESAGFTQIGDFSVEGLPLHIRGFQHQECQAYGVLYEHYAAGMWSDVVRRYADETSWTFSSAKPHGMDSAPWSTVKFLAEESPSALLEKLREESPPDNLQKAGADQFVQRFETAYAREMDWRIQRGGATEEEIRRIAGKNGQECTQEMIEEVQDNWKSAIGDFFSGRLLKSWKKEAGEAARRAIDEGRVFAIHNRLTPRNLAEQLFRHEPDDDDEDSGLTDNIRDWCRESDAFTAFRKALKATGREQSWAQIGEVQKPFRTEFWEYLAEAEPEDEDDDEFGDEV